MRKGAYGAGIFTGEKLRTIVSAANIITAAAFLAFICSPTSVLEIFFFII
jgi:hypothetical protein